MLRPAAWLVTPFALATLVLRCAEDTQNGNDSRPQAGDGGSNQGGSSLGGATAPGGHGGAPESGGAPASGGTSVRGGTAGRSDGGDSGDAAAGPGGRGDAGGADAGQGGGGTGGTPAAGEGGLAGEGGSGDEPGCHDPPSTKLCTSDLSGIGTGDFEVKFTIRAGGAAAVYAVIGQRDVCNHSYFWSAKLLYGSLYVELDDNNQNYVDCWSPDWLNDGQFHRVVVRRTSGVLSIVVDCGTPTTCPAPTNFSRTMAPLGDATHDPCIGFGTEPLEGRVTDRCVRPL
jgi:hypothetical protein